MAAWVEATTREMGQSLINPDKPSVSASALPGDTGKPALGPKPHLMPKPFALQRNATVRPIRAPKTNFSRELHRAASSEALLDIKKTGAGDPNPSESLKSGSNGTVNGSNQSAAPKSVPLCLKPDFLAKPKPEPTKSPGSNNQTGPNSKPGVTAEDVKDVQPRSRAKSLGSQDQKILNQKVQGEAAMTEADVKVSSRCWPPRNRLSMELTSKFESPSHPEKEVRRDSETSKTEKEWPPHSPSESKPSKLPLDTGEMGDEDVSGCSIKRRISLLFDRSTAAQRRDTFNKRDNPVAEITVDIKQRIQNLSMDVPRVRLPSTGGPKRLVKPAFSISFSSLFISLSLNTYISIILDGSALAMSVMTNDLTHSLQSQSNQVQALSLIQKKPLHKHHDRLLFFLFILIHSRMKHASESMNHSFSGFV